jgi:Ca-activated chloride channel family protein
VPDEVANEMKHNFFARFVFKATLMLALLFAVCLCAPAQATNSQSPVPAVERDGKGAPSVKLSAVVLDEKNNFVENLRAEDFIVTENGVPQPITSFAREDLPLSYTLLVDNTGSLRTMLDHVLKTGEAIVAGMRPQDEMSVVRFVSRDKIELLRDFTRNQNALVEAVEQMYTEGGATALLEALYVSAEAVAARTSGTARHRAIVLVTDGGERDPRSKLDEVLTLLRREHVHVFVFGLTDAVEGDAFSQVKGGRKKSRELLETLARETGGRAVFPKKTSEFEAAAAALNRQLQMPEYVLGYSTNNTTNTGKPVAIQLKLANSAMSGRGKLQLHTGFPSR